MNDIKIQEMAFKSNVESLLLPLMVDEDEAAALVAEPRGINWKEEIAHYTARSENLLGIDGQSDKLMQSRQYIKRKCRRHAANLHELLDQARCCQSKSLYRACHLLYHETNVERTNFATCFPYAAKRVNDPCPWKWKEMLAQHIDQTASHYYRRNLDGRMHGVTWSVLWCSLLGNLDEPFSDTRVFSSVDNLFCNFEKTDAQHVILTVRTLKVRNLF